MTLRNIIEIDEEICNGCGQCIPNCPEGALQLIDGKARLVSDLFCDGLGACIGECPLGAINVIEREPEPYNETVVMGNIVKQGKNVIAAHLKHLKDHNEVQLYEEAVKYLKDNNIEMASNFPENNRDEDDKGNNANKTEEKLPCGCPGSAVMDLREDKYVQKNNDARGPDKLTANTEETTDRASIISGRSSKTAQLNELIKNLTENKSQLRQWPIQIKLVPVNAPYLSDADLLIAADCVPFAYAGFHQDFLEGKVVLIGCPKLDDSQYYLEKFTEIFKLNDIKSITVVHMEVPCCFGLAGIIKQALLNAEKHIPVTAVNIGIKGNIVSESK